MAETISTQGSKKERAQPRQRIGVVVSDKMDKTIVIEVSRQVKHPLYKKYVRRRKKLHAHDATNDAHIGDRVQVVEVTRPLSRQKRWRLQRIIERAK